MSSRRRRLKLRESVSSIEETIKAHQTKLDRAIAEGNEEGIEYFRKEIDRLERQKLKKLQALRRLEPWKKA